VGAVDQLGKVIERLRRADLEAMSLEALAGELVSLRQHVDWLEGEWNRRVVAFDHRNGRDLEGHSSTTAFLKHRCRMSAGRALRGLGLGNRMNQAHQIEKAFEVGEVSLDQTRAVADLPERLGDELVRDEAMLASALSGLSVVDTRRALGYWQAAVDGPGNEVDRLEQWSRRYLHVSRTMGDMVKIDGLLDPEAGEVLLAGLSVATPPRRKGDERSPGQRRADGLADLVGSFLATNQESSPERPHLLILADIDSLCGHGGGVHESITGTVLAPSQIGRISCDCTISRVVFGPGSQPLDVGRATRLIPPALARAVIARDRHCRADGCDRPARWCDIHHLTSWTQGGPTALKNLILVCRHHHTLAHGENPRLELRKLEPGGPPI